MRNALRERCPGVWWAESHQKQLSIILGWQ